jgi:hypothetical protein
MCVAPFSRSAFQLFGGGSAPVVDRESLSHVPLLQPTYLLAVHCQADKLKCRQAPDRARAEMLPGFAGH